MKPQLENLKEYTSKLSLTSEEKLDMFNNLRAYSNANPVRSKYTMLFRNSFTYASMFALLIGTSATSIAAEGSLPGDILYPVKTEVNETIVKTLSFTPTSKAKVAVTLMDKRMSELTEMIVTEVDNPEKIDTIITMLEEHKEDLQDFTNQVEENNQEEIAEAVEIYAALESVIDTHIEILEEIAEEVEEKDTQIAIASVSDMVATDTAPKASTQEEPEDITITNPTLDIEPNTEPVALSTTTNATSTAKATTSSIIALSETPEAAGEREAVTKITNFSTRIDPLIESVRTKNPIHNEATSTKIRTDVRRRIIDTTEKELEIEIEEDIEIEIDQ